MITVTHAELVRICLIFKAFKFQELELLCILRICKKITEEINDPVFY